MARVNIVKRIKINGRWVMRSIPRKQSGNWDWNSLPDGRYYVEWYEQGSASLTKIRGSHTWKFGYEGRMIRVNNRESRSTSGDFSFASSFTQGPNPSQAAVDRGNGLASLLLGTGSGSLIQSFKDASAQSFY